MITVPLLIKMELAFHVIMAIRYKKDLVFYLHLTTQDLQILDVVNGIGKIIYVYNALMDGCSIKMVSAIKCLLIAKSGIKMENVHNVLKDIILLKEHVNILNLIQNIQMMLDVLIGIGIKKGV